jgi:hypothetical protein
MRTMLAMLCTVFLTLFASCSSGEQAVKEVYSRSPVTTLHEQGIIISAQYLDRKMLYDRFGNRNNPFLEYQEGRLVVIDFTLEAEYEIRLRISKVGFDYLNALSRPVPRVDFSQYWEQLLLNPGAATTGGRRRYRDWSYSSVLRVINANVLPDSLDIQPGPSYRGFMLFEGTERRYGTARVTVPIFTMSGRKIHEFVFLIDI